MAVNAACTSLPMSAATETRKGDGRSGRNSASRATASSVAVHGEWGPPVLGTDATSVARPATTLRLDGTGNATHGIMSVSAERIRERHSLLCSSVPRENGRGTGLRTCLRTREVQKELLVNIKQNLFAFISEFI